MQIRVYFALLAAMVLLWSAESKTQSSGRVIVFDFDCRGAVAGKSAAIGDSLRAHVRKAGGVLVSRDEVVRRLERNRMKESRLNERPADIEKLIDQLHAGGAALGRVYSTDNLITVEMQYLHSGSDNPIVYDPIVVSSLKSLYSTIPEMARIIVSPDKAPPTVVSVVPADRSRGISEFVDVKIKFSEPMNPATFSLSAKPEKLWSRYDDVAYDNTTNTFTLKMHLYPGTKYEFRINGEESIGFKDLAGNPAPEYAWSFTTGR